MKIPTSFTLFGQQIQIIISNEHCRVINALGQCDPILDRIYITTETDGIKRTDTQIQHALFHELTHMILFKMNKKELTMDEEFVDIFSALLLESILTKK